VSALHDAFRDYTSNPFEPTPEELAMDGGIYNLPPAPGTFEDRVTSRRVDLVRRIKDGIPPVDYLAGSSEILRRGKRHHAVAPKKVGKSLGALVLDVDMALAGEKVVIFDRENGANLYGIAYYEFPRFREDDQDELAAICAGASLVVFDSQRMFLSDLGLEESSNDDYAAFMATLIDPLFRSGIASLILDNAGHEEPKLGRGASAKGDLNEILFAFVEAESFDFETTGRLRLEIMDSRFGDSGTWNLILGGGLFEAWERVEEDAKPAAWQPTRYMEKVSRFIEENPGASKRIIDDAGLGRATYVRQALETLVRQKYVARADGPHGAYVHMSLKPYREADSSLVPEAVDEVGTRWDEVNPRPPSSSARPSSPPLGDEGTSSTGVVVPNSGTTLGRGQTEAHCPRHGLKLVEKVAAG
jgi:hypothetical protein